MKVVIDTNIFLVSISRRSHLNWIFQRLFNEEFRLCVTTEILMEYAEKIEEHMGIQIAEATLKAILNLPNLEKAEVYFKWNLIQKYPDDNKFSDCAVAANAAYLLTHDKDFSILKRIGFPKIEVISAEEIKEILDAKERGRSKLLPHA